MCGVAGYCGTEMLSDAQLASTLSIMASRGPDAGAYSRTTIQDKNIYLLHTRLSILDLDQRSNQPFRRDNLVLSFNGEIYNYKELRTELERRGASFSTASDTEVLLESYRHFGAQCFEKFEGMWALALLDTHSGRLLISRDRFGEKPLLLYQNSQGLYFASEVRILEALVGKRFSANVPYLENFLLLGFRSLFQHSETWQEGVERLPAGTNLSIDISKNEQSPQRYWSPERQAPKFTSKTDCVHAVKTALRRSLELRLRSDVPIAFCLSGGVDSGALASIAAKELNVKPHTFSILDSDARYDERRNIYATIQDLQCQHTEIELEKTGFLERLHVLINYHRAPLATVSYYVHSLLSQAIHSYGYKVAISGTGADELFSGYYHHFKLHLQDVQHLSAYAKALAAWATHVQPLTRNPRLKSAAQRWSTDDLFPERSRYASFLLRPTAHIFNDISLHRAALTNRMWNELFFEVVPVILWEDDLNSMMYQIENRSPFLDRELFEISRRIPTEYLIEDGYAKNILREATAGILNEQVRLDRKKMGFNAALQSLLQLHSKEVQEYMLQPSPIFEIVDRIKIKDFLTQKHSDEDNKFIFNFIGVKIFLEMSY